ncbi:hypothetical protein PFISCL1PPCAC_16913, partial [Pristionchus fissidentatus]
FQPRCPPSTVVLRVLSVDITDRSLISSRLFSEGIFIVDPEEGLICTADEDDKLLILPPYLFISIFRMECVADFVGLRSIVSDYKNDDFPTVDAG